jgi:translation initiation factor IF-2
LSKVRVYELAKDFGMKGPELAELLRKLGFDKIKTHMAVLDEPDQMMVVARLQAHGLSRQQSGAVAEAAPAPAAGRGTLVKKSLPPPVPLKERAEPKELPRRRLPAEAEPAEAPAAEPAAGTAPAVERPVEDVGLMPSRPAPIRPAAPQPAPPQPGERLRPEPQELPAREAPRAEPVEPRERKVERPPEAPAERAPDRPARPVARPERPAERLPERPRPAPAPEEPRVLEPAAQAQIPAEATPVAPEPAAPPEPGKPVKKLLVPQARAQVVGRIELPQETIRDATRRSAPSTERGAGGADRELRRIALQNTQTRTASARTAPGQRRGPGGMTQRQRPGARRGGPKTTLPSTVDPNRVVEITPPVSIKKLSEALGIKVNELIFKLTFDLNIKNKTINSFLTQEEVELVALAAGRNIRIVEHKEAEEQLLKDLGEQAAEETDYLRAPVVTFMGHVDHGKTSLIDALRQSDIAAREAGGITQHIGAYKVTMPAGHSFVVLDTPGHAAFTSMRARGASITDIVVLVVAADDGVMPQTEEAINHAKDANVPIVVAINKCDKPGANPMQVKQQLSIKGLHPEEWGGKTQMAEVSATTRKGIDDLVERIMLEAELLDLKAKPTAPGVGTVIECKQTPEQGVVVNVLVTNGTLRVKDRVLCGQSLSRVRGLVDDHGGSIEEAGPSTPVQLLGITTLPQPGDKLHVVTDVKKAQEVVEDRQRRERDLSLAERSTQTITLESLSAALAERKIRELKIILKADVMGSLEPIKNSLEQLSNDEVRVNLIHSALGGITETDVTLAEASTPHAILIGFNSMPDQAARAAAERAGIDIRFYDVIYTLLDDVKLAIEGMLAPERTEKVLGHAEVRAVFKSSKAGNIAGCFVLDGVVTRNAKARLLRDKRLLHESQVQSLKRMKDDVREVKAGFECGMTLQNFDDFKIGDVIELFEVEMVKRTLR